MSCGVHVSASIFMLLRVMVYKFIILGLLDVDVELCNFIGPLRGDGNLESYKVREICSV